MLQSLKKINGHDVYSIDNTPTVIYSLHGNVARGAIVLDDLSLKPCYIAKIEGYFAHGDTIHEAVEDANNKYLEDLPLDTRISRFMNKYPKLDTIASVKDLCKEHHILTGSCSFGIREFVKSKELQEDDLLTIEAFIDYTINEYGGRNIAALKEAYLK